MLEEAVTLLTCTWETPASLAKEIRLCSVTLGKCQDSISNYAMPVSLEF